MPKKIERISFQILKERLSFFFGGGGIVVDVEESEFPNQPTCMGGVIMIFGGLLTRLLEVRLGYTL